MALSLADIFNGSFLDYSVFFSIVQEYSPEGGGEENATRK